MDLVIRPATAGDTGEIIALLMDIALLHSRGRPDLFTAGSPKYSAAELADIFNNPETPVFVAADENDRAVGYVFCRLTANPAHGPSREYKSLFIDDLCVDRALRGKGIGSALFDKAIAFARENSCAFFELNVWEFNENAVKFYEKHGLQTRKRTMELKL